MKFLYLWLAVIILALFSSHGLKAEEGKTKQSQTLFIELNALNQLNQACRLSFVMKNNLNAAIEELAMEVVLFNQSQQVTSMLLIKNKKMPVRKTLVRQYNLKNTQCSSISQVLVNDIKVCRGQNLTAETCLQSLDLSSRTSAKLGS